MIWMLIFGLSGAQAREVILSVQDPQRQVQGVLQAGVHGSEGGQQNLPLKDDGVEPDHTPGDGIFTGRSHFTDPMVHLKLSAAGRTWTADAVLPDPGRDTVLRLQLGPEDTAVVLQGARGMLGGPGPSGTPSEGLWIWAVLLAGLGIGGGLGGRWLLGRAPEAARLSTGPAQSQVPPRRFAPDQLSKLLELLGDHEVFLLGVDHCAAEHRRCEQARVTPEALIRGIEQAAVSSQRPVALVVCDPTSLELRSGARPASTLSRAVDGRFALWLSDGPSEWGGLD